MTSSCSSWCCLSSMVLDERIVTPVDRIRETVDDILYNGVILTGELDNVPELLAVDRRRG